MSVTRILACAACFGDPNSPLSKGAIAGVATLMACVGLVLAGIVAVALTWARRARAIQRDQLQQAAGARPGDDRAVRSGAVD